MGSNPTRVAIFRQLTETAGRGWVRFGSKPHGDPPRRGRSIDRPRGVTAPHSPAGSSRRCVEHSRLRRPTIRRRPPRPAASALAPAVALKRKGLGPNSAKARRILPPMLTSRPMAGCASGPHHPNLPARERATRRTRPRKALTQLSSASPGPVTRLTSSADRLSLRHCSGHDVRSLGHALPPVRLAVRMHSLDCASVGSTDLVRGRRWADAQEFVVVDHARVDPHGHGPRPVVDGSATHLPHRPTRPRTTRLHQ